MDSGQTLSCLVAVALLGVAGPASAQWTRVTELPASDVFSVWSNGDTIAAGVDTAVYVSTNAGATWERSAKVSAGVTQINAARFRNGRLYAGTFGQGVFVSDNLGDSWLGYSQGLVGGIGNSQLFLKDLLFRGDSLFAATSGDGPWVRNLGAGTWGHFGSALETNQASNMNALASGGSRLLATGGFNGTVFFRDPGDADWTRSWLNNVGAAPGLGAFDALWTGTGWLVSSNSGVFRSPLGQSPWEFFDPGLGTLFGAPLVLRGHDVFVSFGSGTGSVIELSHDDGATWEVVDDLPFVFTYDLARNGTDLYAGRLDGLWRRSIANVSVPDRPAAPGLRFALLGPQPVGDKVRFRFELPAAGRVTIDVFDVAGRRADGGIEGSWPAGTHEVSWSARVLGPGIYWARLEAGGRYETLRLVRGR